jgi:hypothetical protein
MLGLPDQGAPSSKITLAGISMRTGLLGSGEVGWIGEGTSCSPTTSCDLL